MTLCEPHRRVPPAPVGGAGTNDGGVDDEPHATSIVAPRPPRVPGMGFGHELLIALIMAIVMTATIFLRR